jgi:endonuclease/exonuclease/phosphatase (EEP) superfamily protein YafD
MWRKIVRGCFWGISVIAALFGLMWLVLYWFPALQQTFSLMALAATFCPLGMGCWLIAAATWLVLLKGRRKAGALVAVLALLAQLVPLWSSLPRPWIANDVSGDSVTVLAYNMLGLSDDLLDLQQVVDHQDPDVVVLTEFSPGAQEVMNSDFWQEKLPYRQVRPMSESFYVTDCVYYSKHPLKEVDAIDNGNFSVQAIEVADPQGSYRVIGAHPAYPLNHPRWLCDSQDIATLVDRQQDHPLIVAGDLNATASHVTFRDLTSRGLTDVAKSSGAGAIPTWPAAGSRQPLIAIDHVLVNDHFAASSFSTVDLTYSDHVAVVAEVVRVT